jgi:hypothetical protein
MMAAQADKEIGLKRTNWVLCLLALILAGERLQAAALVGVNEKALDQVFQRLYSDDLSASQKLISSYVETNPGDSVGLATKAMVLMYGEMHRLNLLADGMFSQQEKGGKKGELSPEVAKSFWAQSNQAIEMARQQLKKDPNQQSALLALSIAFSTQRDFAAVLEKRYRNSLDYAREGQAAAVKLIRLDPNFGDAYMTTGFNDYLLDSLPLLVRPLAKMAAKFEDSEATKAAGIRKLEVAATRGRFLKPFAQMMLAMFYRKEKRNADSVKMLAELHAAFPENRSFQREFERVKRKN